MRQIFQLSTAILLILIGLNLTYAQDKMVDRLAVKFSNPDKPGFIKASLVNGGIFVEGYKGKEVIIEASTRSKKIISGRKANGMIRIPVTTTGLTVEEEDNEMTITTESWKRTTDLNIRVPIKTSLQLHCVNAGDITVEKVNGELDIDNINGKVTLTNISGAVVAHALNKDLIVTFDKIDSKKSMSFSTLNGDIDVTFPKKLKADVKLKSDNGEIYSDFEIKMSNKPRRIIEENTRNRSGKYKIQIDKNVYGKINGGGQEIQFISFNGDIFIRYKK